MIEIILVDCSKIADQPGRMKLLDIDKVRVISATLLSRKSLFGIGNQKAKDVG